MQTQQVIQSVTWITFAIEAVKILGPAGLALGGTWIALRYQRKAKQIEIDAQMKLKDAIGKCAVFNWNQSDQDHVMWDKLYQAINDLTVILHDLFEKKRHALFAEYLPK